ncbi:hypothetical protein GMPD_42610 [Geomonas paludis]|uniref:Uncharacterized protein n=1 Tax=Geomonas paludis TaxID=2740185 RepID=A0A6V8N1L6_9BACT|nr:hypothetical protein GMPD_42610 [Geomonas paludis]
MIGPRRDTSPTCGSCALKHSGSTSISSTQNSRFIFGTSVKEKAKTKAGY